MSTGLGCVSCLALMGTESPSFPTSDQMGDWAVVAQENSLHGLGASAEDIQKIASAVREEGVKMAQSIQDIKNQDPRTQAKIAKSQAGAYSAFARDFSSPDWTTTLAWVAGGAAVVGLGIFAYKKMTTNKAFARNPRKRKHSRK